jgi:hypothetical protein
MAPGKLHGRLPSPMRRLSQRPFMLDRATHPMIGRPTRGKPSVGTS